MMNEFVTYSTKDLEIPQLHRHLLGAIGPRPIAFASTIDEQGVPNLAPFSFFNVFSANPPILIFSPARSGKTAEAKDTYYNVKKVAEVVVNVVNYDIVHKVNLASCPYPAGINEFVKAGFTPLPSETVRPFRVAESPVQFECKVIEVKELGAGGAAGNLIICEVTMMHIRKDLLDENGLIDQFKIDLVSRMGGPWYCRSDKNSMFKVVRPMVACGIGFDNLPEDILNSKILTANNLGQLALVEQLPDETSVNEYKLLELSEFFLSLEQNPSELEQALHRHAKELLDADKIEEAWMTLLSFNNG
ncbi:MAG: flavin reductase family protein [Crocinitomicaceae bacterium]|nr:flavin reductase family protein [Crocinitomicaceae bacterium]